MVFDWTIDVGNMITIIGVIFAMISAFYVLKSDVRSLDARQSATEASSRDQIAMNIKLISELGAVRQDVAVIRDRVEPPPMSTQSPTKGS